MTVTNRLASIAMFADSAHWSRQRLREIVDPEGIHPPEVISALITSPDGKQLLKRLKRGLSTKLASAQLSFNERKIIVLTRLILAGPSALLLDHPCAGMCTASTTTTKPSTNPSGFPTQASSSGDEIKQRAFKLLFAGNTKMITPAEYDTEIQIFYSISFRNKAVRADNLGADSYFTWWGRTCADALPRPNSLLKMIRAD